MVEESRYLGVHLDTRLDWKCNTEAVYRKGQSIDTTFCGSLGVLMFCGKCCICFSLVGIATSE